MPYLNAAQFDFTAKQKRNIERAQRIWPELNPKDKHTEKQLKKQK